jgi:hypothetical protein
MALMLCSLSRSDDLRLIFLADICRPVRLSSVGPVPCYAISLVKRGGKTQKVRLPLAEH